MRPTGTDQYQVSVIAPVVPKAMAELHVLGQVQESTERVRRHMHVHCPCTTCYRGFVPQLVLPQVLGASGFETTTLFCKCIPRAFLRSCCSSRRAYVWIYPQFLAQVGRRV